MSYASHRDRDGSKALRGVLEWQIRNLRICHLVPSRAWRAGMQQVILQIHAGTVLLEVQHFVVVPAFPVCHVPSPRPAGRRSRRRRLRTSSGCPGGRGKGNPEGLSLQIAFGRGGPDDAETRSRFQEEPELASTARWRCGSAAYSSAVGTTGLPPTAPVQPDRSSGARSRSGRDDAQTGVLRNLVTDDDVHILVQRDQEGQQALEGEATQATA